MSSKNNVVLPSLTMDGYITHIPNMLIKLYYDFITVDYSQSISYYGSIHSMRYLIYKYGSDLTTLKVMIEESLYNLIYKYLSKKDGVLNKLEVNVTYKEISESNYTIITNLLVIFNDIPYELLKELNGSNNTISYNDIGLKYLETGEI